MACPDPHMYISGVGSLSIWSGGSLICSSSLRGRALTLNGDLLDLVVGIGCFVFGHVSDPSEVCHVIT